MDFNLFNHKVLSINLYKKDVIIGIGSKVDEDNHVLFLDMDNSDYDSCCWTIEMLRRYYKLGTALILKSSFKNYHIVFFDILPYNDMIKIQKTYNLKHGCISEMKGESTLRLSSKFGNKIELLRIIKGVSNFRKSFAHKKVFEETFNITIPLNNIGFNKEVALFNYEKRLKIW